MIETTLIYVLVIVFIGMLSTVIYLLNALKPRYSLVRYSKILYFVGLFISVFYLVVLFNKMS